jgi:hypothetical protein
MRLQGPHIAAIVALVASVIAIGNIAAQAQSTPISISQNDQIEAAEALAAGHYGVELTPPQGAANMGPAAFLRLGEAANPPTPNDSVAPLVIIPLPSWGPVDLHNFGGGSLITTTQWPVYLGCSTNSQSCWGNPQQFITDLNTSRFIHVVDQYVGSVALKRYPLAGTYIYNNSPVGTFLSESDTLAWLHAAVGSAGGASKAGPGNLYHLFVNQGIDVCSDPYNSECYAPDHAYNFTFCGYHSYVYFNDYGTVYFTVEPYQPVNGCFSNAPDLTSATANVLSHEIFEAITDPNLNAWYGTGNPIDNLGEEIGDQCVWLNIYPQKLNFLHPAYYTQNEYSNKYHSCVDKP